MHGSSKEAFRCYVAYLMKIGYERIGMREFRSPEGGPILVLTKQTKFGSVMRPGKRTAGQIGQRMTYPGKQIGGTRSLI
jgi:hypothetical protein